MSNICLSATIFQVLETLASLSASAASPPTQPSLQQPKPEVVAAPAPPAEPAAPETELTRLGGARPGRRRTRLSFNQLRVQHIRKLQAQNPTLKFKDASKQWMLSTERAALLATLPEAELKKRRFM